MSGSLSVVAGANKGSVGSCTNLRPTRRGQNSAIAQEGSRCIEMVHGCSTEKCHDFLLGPIESHRNEPYPPPRLLAREINNNLLKSPRPPLTLHYTHSSHTHLHPPPTRPCQPLSWTMALDITASRMLRKRRFTFRSI